jgi:hypothetical protein
VAAAKAAVGAADETHGGACRAWEASRTLRARHDRDDAAMTATTTEAEEAEVAHATADDDVDAAAQAHQDALATLHARELTDAVIAAAAGCAPSDDGPVCDRPLPADFVAPGGVDLAAAHDAVDEADAALQTTRRRQQAAAKRHTEARTRAEAARAALKASGDELAAADTTAAASVAAATAELHPQRARSTTPARRRRPHVRSPPRRSPRTPSRSGRPTTRLPGHAASSTGTSRSSPSCLTGG